jgi:hypothetical protein
MLATPTVPTRSTPRQSMMMKYGYLRANLGITSHPFAQNAGQYSTS